MILQYQAPRCPRLRHRSFHRVRVHTYSGDLSKNGARSYTFGCVRLPLRRAFTVLTYRVSQIDSTGQTNSIMTFYELTEPSSTKGELSFPVIKWYIAQSDSYRPCRLCRPSGWSSKNGLAATNQAEQSTDIPDWRWRRCKICVIRAHTSRPAVESTKS